MSDWRAVEDKASGKTYYYNKLTKETTWTKPAGFVDPSSGAAATPSPATAGAAAGEKPDEWKEVYDKASNKCYYYNRKTKETSWTAPASFIPAKNKPVASSGPSSTPLAVAAAGAAAAAAAKTVASPASPIGAGDPDADENWREAFDSKSGKYYYYNKVTKKTLWTDPRKNPPPRGAAASVYKGPGSTTAPQVVKPVAAITPVPATAATTPLVAKPGQLAAMGASTTSLGGSSTTSGAGRRRVLDSDSEDEKAGGAAGGAVQRQASDFKARAVLDDDSDSGSDDEDFNFLFAKHRHGFVNRILRTGEVFDTKKLMTFKKSLIKKALLKANRHLDDQCIQTFKNIMSYMQDRKSSKPPNEHADKLLRNVMTSPAGLRDEVYLQLCKQTTNHPKGAHAILGWELMMACLASFPPSKPLKKFLLAYYQENAEGKEHKDDPATQAVLKEFAAQALENMPRIMTLGQRKEVMSVQELDAIRQRRGVSIRIHFMDATFKTLIVDSYTLTSDVVDMLVKKLNLTVTHPFALYEQYDGMRIIQPKERILDLVAKWDHAPEEKKAMAAQAKFVYKARLVLKADSPDILADPEAVNLLYLQSVADVVKAHYPVKDSQLTILAALQLQATFGDYHSDMHGNGWLLDKLEQYVPAVAVQHRNPNRNSALRAEWEQKILVKYEKIKGFTTLEAKLNYLDYVQEFPVYGVSYFVVQQRQFKDYPSPLLLGITSEGALLVHPGNKSVLDNYGYTDVVTWGHSDEKFILVVGNVVQQRKLVFKTTEGIIINQLIHDYVKIKVQRQKS